MIVELQEIKLKLAYGDEVKTLELSTSGGGGGNFDIYINRYYQGAIVNYFDGLKVCWQVSPPFGWTAFENEILVEIITGK